MKKFRNLIALFSAFVLFCSISTQAMAEEIAIVNVNKIIENYTKAQEVTADLKVKESEIQKFVMEAQKKIKNANSPLEKKNLEEKLGEQFNIKRTAFANEQAEQWKKVEDDVIKAIESYSKQKKIDMVLNDQNVIIGGKNITDDIIKKLNTK